MSDHALAGASSMYVGICVDIQQEGWGHQPTSVAATIEPASIPVQHG